MSGHPVPTRRNFRIFTMMGCLAILAGLGYAPCPLAAQPVPAEIWAKVAEANQVWLRASLRSITYEMEYQAFFGNRREASHSRIWFAGPDKVRMEVENNISLKLIYNNGVRGVFDVGEQPFYSFAQPPYGFGVGFRVKPALITALQGVDPASLRLAGETTAADGRPLVILEAPALSGYSFAQIELPTYDFRPRSPNFTSARFYVDPANGILTRIEEFNDHPDPIQPSASSYSAVWEFPNGYFNTPEGPAPQTITHTWDLINSRVMTVFEFQLLPGDIWFAREAFTLIEGNIGARGTILQAAPGPIDPALFDLEASGIKVSEPGKGTAVISGRILHKDTQQPVEGALVRLYGNPEKIREPLQAESATGPDGTFTFTQLADQLYYLTASKEGLVSVANARMDARSFEGRIPFDPHLQAWDTLSIRDGQSESGVELYLADPRTVKGTVIRSDTNEPVAEAQISAEAGRGFSPLKTASRQDGTFEFQNLSARTYYLAARKEGFFPTYWDEGQLNEGRNSFAQSVDLASARSKDGLVLKIAPGGVITGRVLNPEGQPVAGALVSANWVNHTQSGAQGVYQFNSLPTADLAGEAGITLIASASGYLGCEVGPIQIPNAAAPVQQDLTLNAGGTIAGTVTDPTGTPIVNLTVNIISQDISGEEAGLKLTRLGVNPFSGQPVTREKGEYVSGRLLPGKYTINAATDGYEIFVQHHVEAVNQQETKVNIVLTPTLPIAGTVVDPAGIPLEDAEVSISRVEINEVTPAPDANGSPDKRLVFVTQQKTNAAGVFSFNQLSPGTYNLNVKAAPREGQITPRQTVENLSPGQTGLVIQLPPYLARPTLKGRVVDAQSGAPLTTFSIRYWESRESLDYEDRPGLNPYWGQGKTIHDASGEFFLPNLAPRPLEFIVSAPGHAARAIGPFAFQPGEGKETFVSLLPEGIIQGVVSLPGGAAQNPLNLTIRPHVTADLRDSRFFPPWFLGLKSQIQRNGAFRIQNVPAGIYDLEAAENGGAVASALCVPVTPGETAVLPALSPLPKNPPVTFQVIVKNPDGTPTPNQNVHLYDQGFPNRVYTRQTGADGRAAFETRFHQPGEGAVIGIGGAPVHLYPADPGQPVSEFVYAPQSGEGVLKGVVIFSGDNVSGEPVYLVDSRAHPPLRIYAQSTSEMGRFAFEGLPPGMYHLIIGGSHPDKPFRWLEVAIEEKENKFLEISLNGPMISGFTIGPDNHPASGAYVQLRLPEAKTQILRPYTILRPARSTQAGEFGQYQFPHLQEGTYELWSSRYSVGLSPVRPAEIKTEDVKDVNLQLK
ncbi:MAG: carboxypeptidase regulatory-like domain-containing protein [bacterium]